MVRRHSGTAVAAVAVAFLAAAWPYLLGTWIAVQVGAEMRSPARSATGWSLEAVYVTGLPFIVWLLVADPARRPLLRILATTTLAVLTLAVLTGALLLLVA
jgi:hypothetical protein